MNQDESTTPDTELSEAIPRLARASVLVIGDVMLDRYVFGTVARISPEAPVPVLSVDRELALPGGADQEVTGPIHPKLAERMLRIAGDALAATSVTVLSDYRKGLLSGDVPRRIIEAARAAGRPTVVDPRGPDYDRFAGADVAVPSLRELESVTGMAVDTESRIAAAAGWLRTAHGFGAVVVNKGAEGLSVVNADGALHVQPAISEVFDLSGAADTVVAALAAGLASGLPLAVAARLANLAMAVAAGQPGMAVAQGTDLVAMLTPQGRALRKIVATEVAVEQVDRWRRMGLRTGLITTDADRFSRARLDTARIACDRLVLGMETPAGAEDGEGTRRMLSDAAGLPSVDLICMFPEGAQTETLLQLRPDLLIDATPSAVVAELVRGWGGEVLAG